VRTAWRTTHDHLSAAKHIPAEAEPELENVKGHSYFLFDPAHLTGAARDNAMIIGDSLGLAHPVTGEGILPAVISGRCAAQAILAGDSASYPARLARHPVIEDYARVVRIVRALRGGKRGKSRWWLGSVGRRATARGFGWMFSGGKLPVPRLVDRVLDLLPGGG
jgi:flavin-dependent dehydrogenase